MAVIAAFKFDDSFSACIATGQPKSAHGGLGPRAHHSQALHAGHELANSDSKFGFDFSGRAKSQAFLRGISYAVNDSWMGMASNHWSPGADIINVPLPFCVIEISAFTALKENGRATYTLKCTNRRINSSG